MTVWGKPLGLVLMAALLIILSLRAAVWMLGDWLVGEGFLGTGRAPVYMLIGAASLVSAIGLLLRRPWARWLALALCSSYAVLLVGTVIAACADVGPAGIDLGGALASGVESAVVAGSAWWYLTRPNVVCLFERPAQ